MVYGVVIDGVPMVKAGDVWFTLEEYATFLGHKQPVMA